ncbi:LOW QUALITY PROTEIN: hypothetical protein ACHAW5_001993 [Stephanodiscus triporus]|uniref:UBA domain-containing protein n=1 Tax=Stephanodiscus triporus TaxID=2934178 RepID=A0ABD3QKS7_9STRA
MEGVLSRAIAELSIRSEVESTLTSMLHDVEHACALESYLRSSIELRACRERLEGCRARHDDVVAAWDADRRERERLGSALLYDVVGLSARMMTMTMAEEEEERRNDDDDVGAGTTGGRKPVDARGGGRRRRRRRRDDARDATSEDDEDDDDVVVGEEGGGDGGGSTGTYDDDDDDDDDDESFFAPHELDETTLMNIFAYADPMDVMNFAHTNKALLRKVNVMFGMGDDGGEGGGGGGERRDADRGRRPRGGSEEGGTTDPAAAAVVADDYVPPRDEQSEEKIRTLVSMGFDPDRSRRALDAAEGDVVSAAELLLLGADEEQQHRPTSHLPPTATVPTSTSSSTPQNASHSASFNEAETKKTASNTTAAKSSQKLFGTPGPTQHRRQGSSTSVGSGGNPFSQVSSWFGGAGAEASSVSSAPIASSIAPSSNTSSAPPDAGSEIKLNAAMANSMASKLTPAELSIILRMREKLQKCEADAIKWRVEKEDAEANLASVEAVKEFLVTRVRDTERVVQAQKEEMREVQKKSLEDQEVIVFLDERVKELERVVEELKSKEATIKKETSDIVTKNEKKSRVLSDMLRFEREQIAANEKEWKTAKKLLVKEVRSCRARIVALEAEIEGCSQQNAQLKRGLLALQSANVAREEKP